MIATATPTAPVPALAIDGAHAVITGIRWSWQLRCWTCREVTYVHADGGRILAGINASVSKKTCRFYQTDKPCLMPALPAVCPLCGETDRPFAFAGNDRRAPLAHHNTLPVLDEMWAAMRVTHPVESERAHQHDLRTLCRA